MKFRTETAAEAAKPRTKAEIIDLLKEQGEKYAATLESLSDDFLSQSVAMPPGGALPSRTRFDMLASVKEHENAPSRSIDVDRTHAGNHAAPHP